MSNLNNNTTQLEALLAKVNALPDAGSGGTDTSDATATANEIFAGETAYVAGGKVTGTFTIEEELTEQNDLISQIATLVATKANPPSTDTSDATATANDILSGKTAYVKGSKITGKISSKSAATYTPSTTNQTIASGQYLSGAQTIKGDANLKSENIASGVSIFGVTGTHSGAEDLDAELTTQESLISQLSTILDSKASGSGGGSSVETCSNMSITSYGGFSSVTYATVDASGSILTVMDTTLTGLNTSFPVITETPVILNMATPISNIPAHSNITIISNDGFNVIFTINKGSTSANIVIFADGGN